MSDLLTRDEYQAIADQIIHPRSGFIDGSSSQGLASPWKVSTQRPVTPLRP